MVKWQYILLKTAISV